MGNGVVRFLPLDSKPPFRGGAIPGYGMGALGSTVFFLVVGCDLPSTVFILGFIVYST